MWQWPVSFTWDSGSSILVYAVILFKSWQVLLSLLLLSMSKKWSTSIEFRQMISFELLRLVQSIISSYIASLITQKRYTVKFCIEYKAYQRILVCLLEIVLYWYVHGYWEKKKTKIRSVVKIKTWYIQTANCITIYSFFIPKSAALVQLIHK